MLLPEPATNVGCNQIESSREEDGTNVFRRSKEGILMTSSRERWCLEKTRLRISCDEYHMRCCGWLRGLVERAICECSPAIGSLKGWVTFDSQRR